MRIFSKFSGLTAAAAVAMSGLALALILAGCATTVPIKGVRMPTINGMDAVRSLGIQEFVNKSGVASPLGAQLTQYLTDQSKQGIQATGKFTVLTATDPNADGVFFGELRNVGVKDTQSQSSRKDDNGNTIVITTYRREVAVELVYGVRSTRTGAELGTVPKQGSASSSSSESPSRLADPLALARNVVDSQMKTLEKDLVATIVSENRKLMSETSKDKALKQLMKDAQALVKNRMYVEAIKQYDEIGEKYNSVAAIANASILREAIASDAAASAQMAQLDSARSGLAGRAVASAVESLNSKLPSGATIMIMKTNSTETNMLNDVVDQITTSVVQGGKLKIVDRSNQALINAEQQFQLSGNVDDNAAVSIGKQLGAKYAVLCGISGTMSNRRLNLKVLDIETSQITDQTNFDI
jgi:hypothetical protein